MATEKKLEEIEARWSKGASGWSVEDCANTALDDVPWLISEVKRLRGEKSSANKDWNKEWDVGVEILSLNAELDQAKSEVKRLQTANGQLTADLMGCRDGALVRDLRAEVKRLMEEKALKRPAENEFCNLCGSIGRAYLPNAQSRFSALERELAQAKLDVECDEKHLCEIIEALDEANVPSSGERTGPKSVEHLTTKRRVQWLCEKNAALERENNILKAAAATPQPGVEQNLYFRVQELEQEKEKIEKANYATKVEYERLRETLLPLLEKATQALTKGKDGEYEKIKVLGREREELRELIQQALDYWHQDQVPPDWWGRSATQALAAKKLL